MGLRFRKSITLFPGLRLNFGPRGPSLSIGRKGASISAGAGGVYANVGLPGSGVSYRKKLFGGVENLSNNPSATTDPTKICQEVENKPPATSTKDR